MLYPNLVTLGSINSGATLIQADVSAGLGSAVTVTLLMDYALANPRPPGFPFRPSMTGAPVAGLDYPRTLASGTTLEVLQVEATALINAGAAETT
jgi:hypothetical protein